MARRLLSRRRRPQDVPLASTRERFDTVELNTTGYRLPAEDQFERWAEQTPAGFTFAVKMPLTRLDRVGTFVERVAALGDRLGPVRIVVQSRARRRAARVPARLAAGRSSTSAYDFRHESWEGVDGVVARQRLRRGSRSATSVCASRRTRTTTCGTSPPRLRPPAYVYFRHEDEATAPDYAARLRELLSPSSE